MGKISESSNNDKSAFEVLSEDIDVRDIVGTFLSDDELYCQEVVKEKSTLGLNVEYIDYSVIYSCKTYTLP